MRLSLVAALVFLTGAVLNASTGPIPLNCNRACLENLVDQYLAAVVAHDPKKMPFSADVKYTENYQVLQLGDGFWKTAPRRNGGTELSVSHQFSVARRPQWQLRFLCNSCD